LVTGASAYQYGCFLYDKREVIQRLCAEVYVTWQGNLVNEEGEQDGTSSMGGTEVD